MKDKQWNSIILKCNKAHQEYLRLLQVAEEEYRSRYGHYPSEVDDDWWIDTMHYGKLDLNLDKIKSSAEDRRFAKVNN